MGIIDIAHEILPDRFVRFVGRFWSDLQELFWDFVMSIPLHIVRVLWFKAKVPRAKTSKQLAIYRHIRIKNGRGISIGNNVVMNRGVLLDGRSGLDIGNNVDIGENVRIWTLEHDPNNNHVLRGEGTTIGDYVWIAPCAIIMPGVTIGRGAIVAGGSIVTHDVEPMSIVAGVPAKEIGKRSGELNYSLDLRLVL